MLNFSLSELVQPESRITILDVGASMTEQPPYAHLIRSGLVRLVGFEPDREQCEKLRNHYGRPHDFFPYFVGDGKPAVFWETNWFATGSLFKPNTPLLEKFQNLAELVTPVAQHDIETKRLDDIPEIGAVDYIKIDVQGAELKVFEGGEKLLDNVLMIHTEVEFLELYEGQPLFADVDIHLRGRNFMFGKFIGMGTRCIKPTAVNQDVNQGTHMLWSDVLYLKNWLDPSAFSNDRLIKYAILAHDMYEYVDLAYYLLKHLDDRKGTEYAPGYYRRLSAAFAPAPRTGARPGLSPGSS
ncbi:MAG: FkbM family methyltransferase [Gammaproteobacteria bacterium]|nr:FkbM family methyltransferase [Gammaproteobacteria bacterium]